MSDRQLRSDVTSLLSTRILGVAALTGAALSGATRQMSSEHLIQGAGVALGAYLCAVLLLTEEKKGDAGGGRSSVSGRPRTTDAESIAS